MRTALLTFLFATLTAGALAGVGFGVTALLSPEAANTYRGTDFRFEIPDGWRCRLDGSEFVCRPSAEDPNRAAAIIILTRKLIGPSDTFEEYEAHLSKPKTIASFDGEPLEPSEIISLGRQNISGHQWVIGTHFQSEVPNYYTTYAATITSHVGVLVTFSVHQRFRDAYQPGFDRALSSLRVSQSVRRAPER